MEILVFTDSARTAAAFPARGPNRVRSFAWKEFRRQVQECLAPALCYLDLGTLPKGKLPGCLRLLRARPQLAYALIDPRRSVAEAALAFHEGAADYVERGALREGIGQRRLTRVLAYLAARRRNAAPGPPGAVTAGQLYKPSGSDWSQVVHEREYTFGLLFIELDGKEEMEKKYGMKNLGIALSAFRAFIESAVRPAHGRVWIWSGFGGIILFPFSGGETPTLQSLFRLILFKHLYDIEESLFPNFLSLRLVLTLGNVVYSERNVGSVVSDSLNSIFHLGREFAQPGNFYVTEEALGFGHPALRDFFLAAGDFEGRRMLRMRLPLHRNG